MQFRRRRGRIAALLLGAVLAGCSSQPPSDIPAVDALVGFYDVRSGLWPTTGWWNSANALTALTDYMITSGDRRYLWVLDNTFTKKRSALRGNFTNDFIDDTGWWALAWIRAYDLTGDQRYLNTARYGVDYMWSHADDVCGGGLWWTVNHEYKNAIVNELFIKAAAELDHRLGGNTVYRDRAIRTWHWLRASGMINAENLVNDGLDGGSCRNNGGTTWTYNQGVILGALVALHRTTGDEGYLDQARELALASTHSQQLNIDGVLTEPCERTGCDVNGVSFKGIYVRNLGELDDALDGQPFTKYLTDQANSSFNHNRNAQAQYGVHWAGPLTQINAATQTSAVDLLVAAQRTPAERTSAERTAPAG